MPRHATEDSARPGPEGGRIEPLRGEHARPLFFERAWGTSFLERFVPKVAFGTICPGVWLPKTNQK